MPDDPYAKIIDATSQSSPNFCNVGAVHAMTNDVQILVGYCDPSTAAFPHAHKLVFTREFFVVLLQEAAQQLGYKLAALSEDPTEITPVPPQSPWMSVPHPLSHDPPPPNPLK